MSACVRVSAWAFATTFAFPAASVPLGQSSPHCVSPTAIVRAPPRDTGTRGCGASCGAGVPQSSGGASAAEISLLVPITPGTFGSSVFCVSALPASLSQILIYALRRETAVRLTSDGCPGWLVCNAGAVLTCAGEKAPYLPTPPSWVSSPLPMTLKAPAR